MSGRDNKREQERSNRKQREHLDDRDAFGSHLNIGNIPRVTTSYKLVDHSIIGTPLFPHEPNEESPLSDQDTRYTQSSSSNEYSSLQTGERRGTPAPRLHGYDVHLQLKADLGNKQKGHVYAGKTVAPNDVTLGNIRESTESAFGTGIEMMPSQLPDLGQRKASAPRQVQQRRNEKVELELKPRLENKHRGQAYVSKTDSPKNVTLENISESAQMSQMPELGQYRGPAPQKVEHRRNEKVELELKPRIRDKQTGPSSSAGKSDAPETSENQ